MARANVSVSIDSRLLAELDERVENGEFKDRSKAVEKGVRELLNNE